MIKSDSVQDSFWSNHKDVSNSIRSSSSTYEHLYKIAIYCSLRRTTGVSDETNSGECEEVFLRKDEPKQE